MRRTGVKLLGAAAMATAGAALLPLEWKLAKRGPQLADDPPVAHDGRVGGDGDGVRIVWLGDSSVAGAGATSALTSMPHLVAAGLGRPVDLRSLAVSGSLVSDVRRDQVDQVAALSPDVVIISITTNDVLWRTPRPQLRADYEAVLAALPEGVLAIACGPIDLGTTARFLQPLRALMGWLSTGVNAEVRGAAEARGAVFVDLMAACGGPFRRDPDRYLAVDRFHASDDGYRLLADAILAELRPALDRRDRLGATP
jgi:lysophospholipase L1-like esterase